MFYRVKRFDSDRRLYGRSFNPNKYILHDVGG